MSINLFYAAGLAERTGTTTSGGPRHWQQWFVLATFVDGQLRSSTTILGCQRPDLVIDNQI